MDEQVLLEKIAGLEGQVMASRLALASLLYATRTEIPIMHRYRKVDGFRQLLEEEVHTAFPDQRLHFLIGLRHGWESTAAMADTIERTINEDRTDFLSKFSNL